MSKPAPFTKWVMTKSSRDIVKCQEETGEDSGHQVRKGGFVKSVKWGGSKIQGGLIGVAAGLPELRHDA